MPNPRYLLQRPKNKGTWYVRFQYSEAAARLLKKPRVIERSLHTKDVLKAQINAAKDIFEHHRAMLKYEAFAGKRQYTITEQFDLEPGKSTTQDGYLLHATADGQYITLTDEVTGKQFAPIPNNKKRVLIVKRTAEEDAEFDRLARAAGDKVPPSRKKKPPVDRRRLSADDELFLSTWKVEYDGSAQTESQYKRALNDLRTITGKSLCEATRADAKMLRDYYDATGVVRSYSKKKLNALATLVRASSDSDHALNQNVFTELVGKKKRRTMIVARPSEPVTRSFSDEEVALIMTYRDKMPRKYQALLMLAAAMGLRPREAMTIVDEVRFAGHRVVNVGTKDPEKSPRSIPIPPIVYPYLPERIVGQLFPLTPMGDGTAAYDKLDRYIKGVTQKMGKYLRRAGVKTSRSKRLYSFRHRAEDKLLGTGVQQAVIDSIIGHSNRHNQEKRNASGCYGDKADIQRKAELMESIWRDLI